MAKHDVWLHAVFSEGTTLKTVSHRLKYLLDYFLAQMGPAGQAYRIFERENSIKYAQLECVTTYTLSIGISKNSQLLFS